MTNSKIWHPYTKFSAIETGLPVIVRGEGPYLFTEDGTRYVDAISSWWCSSLGHSHPEVVAAIQEQAAILQHSILGNLTHPTAIKLADKLSGLLPTPDRHCIFASDGASAIEASLKIAVQYFCQLGQPERSEFVALSDPYHGDTIGAVSVGYTEQFHRPVKPLLFTAHQISPPALRGAPAEVSRKSESDSLDLASAMAEAETLFEQRGKHIAAIVVESMVQGTAGMRMYPPVYFQHLEMLAKKHGALLIVDEIAMGMGRTGKMLAMDHAGIDPDMVCVGKGLTGGTMPFSASIIRDSIYETFADLPEDHSFYHGHTFTGHPIGAATALKVLEIMERDQMAEKAAETGRAIHKTLCPLIEDPRVAEVRSLGMVNAVEFHKNANGGVELAIQVRETLKKRNILARPLGNMLYLALPLNVSEDFAVKIATEMAEVILATS